MESMRTVAASEITKAVRDLYSTCCIEVRPDYKAALQKAQKTEVSPLGRQILGTMLENYKIAETERSPMCQDTGFPVVFVEIGQEVRVDGDLREAIQEGLRQGTKQGFLRSSLVRDPLSRAPNTGDNTPGIIHFDIVPGEKLRIDVLAKGGGSENKSRLYMLKPNDGLDGIRNAVRETVSLAGPDACPPFVVGVGVGGTFDKCAELAKKALMRTIGSTHADPAADKLEKELEGELNKLGVGPQGMGGSTTTVGVFIETHPVHIASFPVAVNIQCNANRHRGTDL
jgi:fumarate hydratase subunit alpha